MACSGKEQGKRGRVWAFRAFEAGESVRSKALCEGYLALSSGGSGALGAVERALRQERRMGQGGTRAGYSLDRHKALLKARDILRAGPAKASDGGGQRIFS